MAKRTPQENLLDGIEANIRATESHIYLLQLELTSLLLMGGTLERRLLLQQLNILRNNLALLKQRRTYALELANISDK